MPYFKSFDGETIRYHLYNQAQSKGKPIIIIHGLGGDVLLLDSFIKKLAQQNPHTQIIAYYLRGHGPSSHSFPPKEPTIESVYVKDLNQLIQFFKLTDNSFILLGHSLGGIIIQEYLNQPSNIKPAKVFLLCSTTQIFGSTILRKLLYKIIQLKQNLFPYQVELWSEKGTEFYEKFATNWDIDLFRLKHDISLVGNFFDWLLLLGAFHGWRNKHLQTINHSHCYYIYGKKDIIVPKVLQHRQLATLNTITKIEIKSGHIAPITNPNDTATIITNNI